MYIKGFFLTFNMKRFGYFRLFREYMMYLDSSSSCCGLHILSALREKAIMRSVLTLLLWPEYKCIKSFFFIGLWLYIYTYIYVCVCVCVDDNMYMLPYGSRGELSGE